MSQNVMVDIEADGPVPGLYSMISFGAVIVEPGLQRTFYAELQPISEQFVPEALAVSGFTREQTLKFPEPRDAMHNFEIWLGNNIPDGRRPIFWADNPGFDFGFMNYYFHRFMGRNPFGWSSSHLGSFYKGLDKNLYSTFKHLRETKHTHNPVDDAIGNAEALLKMLSRINYKG